MVISNSHVKLPEGSGHESSWWNFASLDFLFGGNHPNMTKKQNSLVKYYDYLWLIQLYDVWVVQKWRKDRVSFRLKTGSQAEKTGGVTQEACGSEFVNLYTFPSESIGLEPSLILVWSEV